MRLSKQLTLIDNEKNKTNLLDFYFCISNILILLFFLLCSANLARNRQSFNDAIVFMIGGGNYIEYQNLQDYAKTRSTLPTKRIVYGCTELVNAPQFLEQVVQVKFAFEISRICLILVGKIGSIDGKNKQPMDFIGLSLFFFSSFLSFHGSISFNKFYLDYYFFSCCFTFFLLSTCRLNFLVFEYKRNQKW